MPLYQKLAHSILRSTVAVAVVSDRCLDRLKTPPRLRSGVVDCVLFEWWFSLEVLRRYRNFVSQYLKIPSHISVYKGGFASRVCSSMNIP